MKRKILYGNPYTGFTNEDRKVVEDTLKNMGMSGETRVAHSVHSEKNGEPVLYKWMTAKGRLK